MARPLRIAYPSAHYHVMNRGLERRPVFIAESDHQRFLALLDDLAIRWQVRIFAYCCMTNHYHLAIQTPRGNISRVMRHLDGLYTQGFNRAVGRDGPLFRGRYKAILVEAEAYLTQIVRYIHLNPVKSGVVTRPEMYPWSSHVLYRAPKAPGWLARDEILARFDSPNAFERFIAEGNETSLEDFYKRRRWSPVLGSEQFVGQVMAQVQKRREHPRAHATPQFPTIKTVADVIALRLGVSVDSLCYSRRGRRNDARNLAIHVASRVAGFPTAEICQYFGLGTAAAVTRASLRAIQTFRTKPEIERLVADLLRTLKSNVSS